MKLHQVSCELIEPAMQILPAKMDSTKARLMLLAIGLQESRFEHTRQIGGPARGYWQFESGGGTKGVMEHAASKNYAKEVCEALGVPFNRSSVFQAIENDQVLAACFARLLLWTDPLALPAIGDQQAAWNTYTRIWRPGKPHPQTWPEMYGKAKSFLEV